MDLERQKSARVDLSGAERQLAVERVRVAAMEMRSTEDLARVVAVVSRGMYALGVETLFASITFIDESTDWVHHYFTNPHPLLRRPVALGQPGTRSYHHPPQHPAIHAQIQFHRRRPAVHA
ncbi:uncharacterized protein METZ01_LOCUS221865, partial [marine metagenome]